MFHVVEQLDGRIQAVYTRNEREAAVELALQLLHDSFDWDDPSEEDRTWTKERYEEAANQLPITGVWSDGSCLISIIEGTPGG